MLPDFMALHPVVIAIEDFAVSKKYMFVLKIIGKHLMVYKSLR